MSFNPTFQNYNFIPFYQNNMNINGSNNYLQQLMSQQSMMAPAMNSFMSQMGGHHPYQMMAGQHGVIDSTTMGQSSYPFLYNNSIMGKQPHLLPMMPTMTNPLQMNTTTSIDQRMVLSNPLKNPLLYDSQNRAQSQSTVNYP